jgi:hypothetical protein
VFAYNTSITSFPEFELFTAIKSLAASAFRECGGYGGSIKIPDSVTSVGESCFRSSGFSTIIWSKNANIGNGSNNPAQFMTDSENLEHLIMPNLKVFSGNLCCRGTSNLKKVYFPSTLAIIYIFQSFTPSAELYFYSTTPPTLTIGNNTIGNFTNYCSKVYVPIDSLEDYQTATNWSRLGTKLAGFNPTEIPYPYTEYD